MKLAEALQERADLNRSIQDLRGRLEKAEKQLEKKELKGSTGVLAIRNGKIEFTPNGQAAPAVSRSLIYEKK